MTPISEVPGMLFIPKGSKKKTWVYQVYLGRDSRGQPKFFKRTTKETSRRRAVKVAREKLWPVAQLRKEQLGGVSHLLAAITAEVGRIESDVSAQQAARVGPSLLNFLAWLKKDVLLEKITPELVEDFQRARLQVASRSTVDKELIYILRMLRNNGIEMAKPSAKPGRRTPNRPFTDEELKSFFSHCTEQPLRVAFLTMLSTGARAGDILPAYIGRRRAGSKHVALMKSEVNLDTCEVKIRFSKRRNPDNIKEKTVTIEPMLVQMIAEVMSGVGGEFVFPVFSNLAESFDRVLARAGIPKLDALGRKLTAHSFKHTYSEKLRARGIDAFALQAELGHSDISTTAGYTHAQGGAEVVSVSDLVLCQNAMPNPETEARAEGNGD